MHAFDKKILIKLWVIFDQQAPLRDSIVDNLLFSYSILGIDIFVKKDSEINFGVLQIPPRAMTAFSQSQKKG